MSEVIRKHALEDVYRLCDGILLTVRKYYTARYLGSIVNGAMLKKHAKKLRGVSDAWQLTSEAFGLPVGSYIVGNYLIDVDMPVSDYRMILTLSGGTFNGTYYKYKGLDADIRRIMESYKEDNDVNI